MVASRTLPAGGNLNFGTVVLDNGVDSIGRCNTI